MSLWSSVHVNKVEARGGDSWRVLQFLDASGAIGLERRRHGLHIPYQFVQHRTTVHLLKKWTALSGELQRNFCSGLRGL